MLHPLPLPLSSCLGCIPPLIGLPSLRFYAVGSSLFLLSVCFCLCSLFYRDDVLCWLLLARPFLYAFHAHLRFPVDLVWFRLSCDHGWIRSGSVNVRKQQQQQQDDQYLVPPPSKTWLPSRISLSVETRGSEWMAEEWCSQVRASSEPHFGALREGGGTREAGSTVAESLVVLYRVGTHQIRQRWRAA